MSRAFTRFGCAGISSCSNHKSYLIGFILSIILTIVPFAMVMHSFAGKNTLILISVICSLIQIFVHLVCFLHLDTSSEQRWNLIAFTFTMIIITILVVGSLWIMWHLNHNLMCN